MAKTPAAAKGKDKEAKKFPPKKPGQHDTPFRKGSSPLAKKAKK